MYICIHIYYRHLLFCPMISHTLQHTATHYNTLQHTATHYRHSFSYHMTAHISHTLQHTATHCKTLQTPLLLSYDGAHFVPLVYHLKQVLLCVAACCSVLQRVAACCSVLQRVAACCSMLRALQYGAVYNSCSSSTI